MTKRSAATQGKDDAGVFTVQLSRTATHVVRLDYATADGLDRWTGQPPATAGADHIAASGTLISAPNETRKTVHVAILDDTVDEGGELVLLRFSNPLGAALEVARRETTALIKNDGHLQAMWLARVGRTVGSRVTDGVSERLGAGRAPGVRARLEDVSVSLREGEGGHDSPGVDRGKSGRIECRVATVSSYARLRVTGRVPARGLAGFGTGDMTIPVRRWRHGPDMDRHRHSDARHRRVGGRCSSRTTRSA